MIHNILNITNCLEIKKSKKLQLKASCVKLFTTKSTDTLEKNSDTEKNKNLNTEEQKFQIETPTVLAGFVLSGNKEKDFKEAIQLVHKVFHITDYGMESLIKTAPAKKTTSKKKKS